MLCRLHSACVFLHLLLMCFSNRKHPHSFLSSLGSLFPTLFLQYIIVYYSTCFISTVPLLIMISYISSCVSHVVAEGKPEHITNSLQCFQLPSNQCSHEILKSETDLLIYLLRQNNLRGLYYKAGFSCPGNFRVNPGFSCTAISFTSQWQYHHTENTFLQDPSDLCGGIKRV